MTENKIIRPDFFQIPSVLLEDVDLNTLDGFVYAVVYWYSKLKKEKCLASNETIGKIIKSSKDSVANSLSRLSKKGYIKVIMNEHHHREEIIPLVYYIHPSSVSDTPSSVDEPPLTHGLTPPSSVDEQNNNIYKNKIKEEYTPPKKYSSISDIKEEDLEQISGDYKVSLGFVKLQAEKLNNYCSSKGKRYKNYKSALRNFVLGDMQKMVERRSKGGVLDATNL